MFDASYCDLRVENSVASRRHASAIPSDAIALIRPNGASCVSSGRALAHGWTLTFKPRSAPFVEPLMGWTGSADTLQQVRLQFPTAQSAIRYCRRQGLDFEVHGGGATDAAYGAPEAAIALETRPSFPQSPRQAAQRLGDEGAYLRPAEVFQSPQAVLADTTLSPEHKRNILRSWEWDEYLLEVAAGEAPILEHTSRLAEVRAALVRLDERRSQSQPDFYRWDWPIAA